VKGIVLAGGLGTRLRPLTQVISKQLLPVYDKPMIYYPLATLMSAGIRDILIISTKEDTPRIKQLLGAGSRLGLNLTYAVQEEPKGIAQAFIIGESFIDGDPVTLVLGDNLFYDPGLEKELKKALQQEKGATIFGARVENPTRFGVFDFDASGNVLDVIEKPSNPPSNFAVTGLYHYDGTVCDKAKKLQPSPRGELEITDINKLYLEEGSLKASFLDPETSFWIDAGTIESLYKAVDLVRSKEREIGYKWAAVEEIALNKGYINKEAFELIALSYGSSDYGKYLVEKN
jgi:glucose-1-phosphate thymidylyltransferase